MQALSISPSCLDFAPGMMKVNLHPHPDYLPKYSFRLYIWSLLRLSALRRSQCRSRRDLTDCVQSVLFRPTFTAVASGASQSNYLFVMGAVTGVLPLLNRPCHIGSGMLLLLPMRRATKGLPPLLLLYCFGKGCPLTTCL